MTNEEAIKRLKEAQGARVMSIFGTEVDEVETEMWRETVKIAIKALEKQEKYKWHDLKKNPEDLPQNTDFVLIKYEWEDGDYLNQIDLFKKGKWGCDNPYCKGKVVAWKYTEPFKEEE